jgi:hypothetical protein
MLRVKMCEHIAEGEEGWNKPENRNICPSTMAVVELRDKYEGMAIKLKNTLFNVGRGLADKSALTGVQVKLQDLITKIEVDSA